MSIKTKFKPRHITIDGKKYPIMLSEMQVRNRAAKFAEWKSIVEETENVDSEERTKVVLEAESDLLQLVHDIIGIDAYEEIAKGMSLTAEEEQNFCLEIVTEVTKEYNKAK